MPTPRRALSSLLLAIVCATSVAASAHAQQPPTPSLAVVQDPVTPLHVLKRSDGTFFVDFGRDAFAQLELVIPAPDAAHAGRKITLRLGEKLTDPTHLDRTPGGSIRFLEAAVVTQPGESHYHPNLTKNDARGMPADIGAVMPFRYAELDNLPEETTADSLTAGGIRQMAAHYPFNDNAADFACSDRQLNSVWNLCTYSMKATSYTGLFVDGDRERKPYEADAYINQLGWYYSTDDTTLPRRTHEYLMNHPTWPTEWIMFSVLIGWNDYLFTGNTDSLRAFYPDLQAKTLRALERSDGLISTSSVPASVGAAIHFNGQLRDIVDWPASERDGYVFRPINTVVNAFHCRSLFLMANIAEALGKSADAADYRQAARHTLAALNSALVDPGTGLYVDGEGTSHSSLHANMFPLAFGLVPPERRAKVAAFVRSRGMACSVYGGQFLMDALFTQHLATDAIREMEAPGYRSWRHMAEDVGTTITLEAWDGRYKPNQDWNHAWGAAPANLLPRYVLGVEPLEPGYKKVLIWPRCAGAAGAAAITWARGKVPAPAGPLAVDWHQSADGFHLAIDLPPQTPAQLRLPADWGDQVQQDGRTVTASTIDGTLCIELSTAGHHAVSVGR